MMFTTWFRTGQLVLEAGEVVQLRLWRLSAGGRNAVDESILMVCEKMAAAAEAGCSLASGGTLLAVVERYRGHVAANADRLKTRPYRSADTELRI